MSSRSPTLVTWRMLILTAALLLVVMTALSAAGGYWAWQHLQAHVSLREQTARIRMPSELAVKASVSSLVQVKVKHDLPVRVPIAQTLSIPVDQALPVSVAIDTTVPLDLEVPVRHVLKVDQFIDLDAQVKTRVLGFPVTLPIQGRVPLKADVPINLVIPVHQRVPVSLTTQASVRLTEPLKARIDTVFETTVPIRQALSLPITAPIHATLTFPGQVVEAGLQVLDLTLPFESITVSPRSTSLLEAVPGGRPRAASAP